MRIRKYNKGDEYLITPNSLMADWESEEYVNHWALDNGESFTIVGDDETIQAVVNVFLVDSWSNVLYGWFLCDKKANPRFITKVKEIVKKYLQNGFIICTISKESKMQDKMHEYLGFVKKNKVGGSRLWVAQ